MRYLLDTHIFIWWMESNKKLSSVCTKEINDPHNDIYISSVVAWEITIKKSLGKLYTPDNFEEALNKKQLIPLPITIRHTLQVKHLPNYHKDPFDRLLIATAQINNLTIITADKQFAQYDVKVLKNKVS